MKRSLFFLMFLVCFSLVIAQEDFDNDGMPDSWEKKYNLKYDVNDAALDPDRDGLTNLQEYKRKTDPTVSDIQATIFKKVFVFLKENGIKILLGTAVLFIIFFVIRIISELSKLKKKKKKEEEEKRKKEANAEPLLEKIETPKITSPKERLLDEKKIGEAFEKKKNKGKKKKLKEKKREFLTEAFEEKEGMEKELHPLPFSFSSKIKKVKEAIKQKKKKAEKEKTIFDRLPRRK